MSRNIACYFLLFVVSGWSADGAEIALRSEATCTGPVVRLADVAKIDAAEQPTLADLPLFPAPTAGKTRLVRRHEIQQILLLNEINVRELHFTGAETIAVRSGHPVVEKVILRPAHQFVPSAATVLPAPIRQDRQVRPVVHAAERTTATMPASAADPQERLVQRGKSVTIHALAPGVRISSSGKALTDGAIGDEVAVELAEGRQQVQCRVIGPQTVEIRSGSK